MTISTASGASAATWNHDLAHPDRFAKRHLGPRDADVRAMLATLGLDSLEALADRAVPSDIRLAEPLGLPPALSEHEALQRLRELAQRNRVFRSCIGLGFHDCYPPSVIQRNLLENPGWYTQYTPYQSEIAQGRLEGLLNFQTMVCDLTGLDIANASLLDEATACAEAMTMCHRLKGRAGRNRFLVASDCHPQNVEVVRTRAKALGIEVSVGDPADWRPAENDFAVLLQYPATDGVLRDYRALVDAVHAAGGLVVVATDLLALTLLRPPGEFGADLAVGNTQRFGVPLGYGGPHAAFFASRAEFKREIPGRLVGVSKDARGKPALRLALGTREQHIRRDKATSNICTAQALLANMAAMYAVYHGPDGLAAIARRVHVLSRLLASGLRRLGLCPGVGRNSSGGQAETTGDQAFFDTFWVAVGSGAASRVHELARQRGFNLRPVDAGTVGVALDETTGPGEVRDLIEVFNAGKAVPFDLEALSSDLGDGGVEAGPLARQSGFLQDSVFHRYHSETEMMRYLKRLETRDLSLTTSMIPLGSCTMKLNAASEMLPITWPEFSRIHPFAPREQTEGYAGLFRDLENWLEAVTGFAGVSLQPNAGSQGEYTGLLVIRAYHESRGDGHRRVCLIPTSAHGTNPASAVMAGMKVVPVRCDAEGNIDVEDLRARAEAHRGDLAALMVTYPSTHGVFEAGIREVCRVVHECGGQVYLDGANLNAQVGLTSPAAIGADVCHLNLHKTFSIPHGGGGPGMGPIAVAEHLVPFLPEHETGGVEGGQSVGAVSSAPYGSSSILPISWLYIACMGADGLTAASLTAILNANYIARRLQDHYPVLYRGPGGWIAHECILDVRHFKTVTVEDIAKRLMDYGFHAPTVSWPVAGTLMVEPTESESKEELDRFCEAMVGIHGEILAVEAEGMDAANNLLKNAPHTADMLALDPWPFPYTREQAAFPTLRQHEHKFWPAVGRVDNVYGDRNPVCTCAGMEAFID